MSERETVLWNELWSGDVFGVTCRVVSGPEDTVERRQFVYTRDGEGGHWRPCDRFETVCVTAHLARELAAARGEVERLRGAVVERTAQLAAHRQIGSAEHDPLQGRIHGYCAVCQSPWPCEYAGKPAAPAPAAAAPVAAKAGGCGCGAEDREPCDEYFAVDVMLVDGTIRDKQACGVCCHDADCHPRRSGEGAP